MNIIEALRTGKPIRRPISKHWGSNRSGWLANGYVLALLTMGNAAAQYMGTYSIPLITETDLLSDDWCIKPDDNT